MGKKNRLNQRWTEEEKKELLELYNKLENDELVEHFNRTCKSIYSKASELGIRRSKEMQRKNVGKTLRCKIGPPRNCGKYISSKGYVYVLATSYSRRSKRRYIREHILVMESSIGRYLEKDEVVHHINGIKDDNRIENLQLMTHSEHSAYHMTLNNPNYKHVDIGKLIEEHDSGKTIKRICEENNISTTTYQYKKHRYNKDVTKPYQNAEYHGIT